MIEKPIDVLQQHPVRKTRKQKKQFLQDIIHYAEKNGYACQIEKGSMGSKNLVIGNPDTAKHLITAHYDTCAALPFPNILFPCNFWMFLVTQIGLSFLLFLPAIAVAVVLSIFVKQHLYIGIAFWGILLLTVLYTMYGYANRKNANDNTSGVVTLLEIMRSFPVCNRESVCYVLFDLEECGLVGSSSYRSMHKDETDNQIVWNLDCVGDGDNLILFPSRRLKSNESKLSLLNRCSTELATKSVSVRTSGFSFYPSDQKNFPYGVGIAALKNTKCGLYVGRIHTWRDVILDETNVNILRAAIISAITCDGVQ